MLDSRVSLALAWAFNAQPKKAGQVCHRPRHVLITVPCIVCTCFIVCVLTFFHFDSYRPLCTQILNGVLRSQLSRFGPGTMEVVETTGVIGNLHFGLGNYEDSLKCFTPVLKWQKAHLREDHPAAQKTKNFMKKIKKSIKVVWV